MKLLKRLTALALIALWPLATIHCKLEQLPGFQFLACSDQAERAPHQNDDCEDSCAIVENGFCKIEDAQVCVAASPLLPAGEFLPSLETQPITAASDSFSPAKSPELTVTWQFFFRTALPPRAPSLAS